MDDRRGPATASAHRSTVRRDCPAIDVIAPGVLNGILKRQRMQPTGTDMEILASRILLRPKGYQHSLVFYRDVLGLAIAANIRRHNLFRRAVADQAGRAANLPTPKTRFPGALWLQVRDVYATQEELRGRVVEIAREARQEPWTLHGCVSDRMGRL